MKRQIRGLTLIRPWGDAIAHMGKDIENRTWNCYLDPSDLIAIHNGKSWDKDAKEFIELATEQEYSNLTKNLVPDSQIIAVAKFLGNVADSESPWFVGPVGWEFGKVVPIDPVPCKGKLGLWNLPDDVLAQVRLNYAGALQHAA